MAASDNSPALVATLGLQPQVITRALDILLNKEDATLCEGEAVIIHTAADQEPMKVSLTRLQAEARSGYYPKTLRWRWVPIREDQPDSETVRDVESLKAALLTFRVIYREILRRKRQRRKVHLLIAGGRKSMIVYSMLSAQLLFDRADGLWHLFSTDEYDRSLGARLHVPPGVSTLAGIPLLYMRTIMPVVGELITGDDPTEAMQLQHEYLERDALRRKRDFVNSLDSTDRRILELLPRGLTAEQIAADVHLAKRTVLGRMRSICERYLVKCDLDVEHRPPRIGIFLAHHLGPLFESPD